MNTTDVISHTVTEQYWSQYTSVALGIALLVSEVLPFFKQHSNCEEKNADGGSDVENHESMRDEQLTQKTCLQQSDGLLHAFTALLLQLKKSR